MPCRFGSLQAFCRFSICSVWDRICMSSLPWTHDDWMKNRTEKDRRRFVGNCCLLLKYYVKISTFKDLVVFSRNSWVNKELWCCKAGDSLFKDEHIRIKVYGDSDLGITRERILALRVIYTWGFFCLSPLYSTPRCGPDVSRTLWLMSSSAFLNGIAICVPHSDAPAR